MSSVEEQTILALIDAHTTMNSCCEVKDCDKSTVDETTNKIISLQTQLASQETSKTQEFIDSYLYFFDEIALFIMFFTACILVPPRHC